MTIDDLKAKVDAEKTVVDSAVALIKGLSAQLAAAKDDPAKVQALADALDAQTAELSAAVVANTPVAPAAPAAPVAPTA